MAIARRRFLKSGLLFGASAFLFSQSARPGFARTLSEDGPLSDGVLKDPVYSFTRETFEPYIGGYFESAGARGRMVGLKLLQIDSFAAKAEVMTTTRSASRTDAFALLFRADAALSLTSIHQIQHGALGEFSLFLTRRDSQSGEIFYEAVFNHLR
jgi:uncharacterized protein DUF6916